jgi:hypothetical protein
MQDRVDCEGDYTDSAVSSIKRDSALEREEARKRFATRHGPRSVAERGHAAVNQPAGRSRSRLPPPDASAACGDGQGADLLRTSRELGITHGKEQYLQWSAALMSEDHSFSSVSRTFPGSGAHAVCASGSDIKKRVYESRCFLAASAALTRSPHGGIYRGNLAQNDHQIVPTMSPWGCHTTLDPSEAVADLQALPELA